MAVTYHARFPRTLPDAVTVYELPKPVVNNSVLTTLARNIGFTGASRTFSMDPESLGYQEGRHYFQIRRRSGAISMRHDDKYGIQTERAFDIPDRRCDSIARKFLQSAKLFPLASAKLARVTHLHGAEANRKERKITDVLIDAGVVYRRLVDEVPVIGPGGLAMVNIGPGADVTGLTCLWRTTGKRVGKVKILSSDRAIEAFEKVAGRFKGDTTVIKAEFGYFEQGPLERQSVIEPAYALVYVVRNGEVAHKSVFVINAGERAYSKLMGKKRFAKDQQKPREKPI
jgi:hypothetical protein